MEYNMEPISTQGYYYPSYTTTEPMINHHHYGLTSADYMHGMTVFDHSSCMMPIQNHIGYHHHQMVMDPSLSPVSSHTPTTPMSTSYSPQPDYDYNMNSSSSVTSEISSESSRSGDNVCTHPGCTSKGKFRRRTDLVRHIKTQHEAEKNRIDCQHKWCGRTGTHGFSRRDHLREHLREVHQEKIPFKRQRRSSNNRSPTTKKEPKDFTYTSSSSYHR